MRPAAARTGRAAVARTGASRPGLRLLPGGRTTAPRAPFVVLVLLVLGVGLVGLLLLNTSLQQSSFELRELEQQSQLLRDRHAEVSRLVAQQASPEELARQAEDLGMVPAENREYVVLERPAAAGGE
jgi:Tfp pilus assembly protein PilN